AVAGAPPAAGPIDAVSAALQAVGAVIQQTPEPARLRYAVVSANQELRERELAKLAEFAAAIAGALRDRGVPELAASLAAETGTAVYRVTFARWIAGQAQPELPELPELLRESMAELGDVFTDRLLSSPAS
ncbi:MAG TPA: TetR family transcriptional regulator, partial [Trebonia sp.]|nr:TetR family transcriptional regulator [Trebonia sp.]